MWPQGRSQGRVLSLAAPLLDITGCTQRREGGGKQGARREASKPRNIFSGGFQAGTA